MGLPRTYAAPSKATGAAQAGAGDGLVRGSRVLAEPLRVRARARRDLPRRVPRRAQPVPAFARRTGAAARTALRAHGAVPRRAEPVPLPLLGPAARHGGVGRRGPGGERGHRAAAGRPAVGVDARVVRALGALPVDRQRGPDLLLVRLGIAAVRGRSAGGLPRRRAHGAADSRGVPDALAAVPAGVRRRAHQVARRPLLARPHVPPLPPRDPAEAEPAELVLPPPAGAGAQGRGARQPRRAARRAVLLVHAAADRRRGGRD